MSINNNIYTSTASLFIITDENETDNLEYCTRLLNIFYKKLNDLKINLIKTVLNINQFENIIQQFKQVEKSSNTAYILVTTTNNNNDYIMQSLINNLNGSKHDMNKRIFFLEHFNFFLNFALCFKKISKNECFQFKFDNDYDLKFFLHKLVKTDFNFSPNNIYLFKNNDIQIRNLFSNYHFCSIEIEFLNSGLLETFRHELFKDKFELDNNYINADYCVYEFDNISKLFNQNLISQDLEFLLSKIDYNQFLIKLKSSIDIIEETFKRYKSDQICVSFNGGKDCCVVLYMFYAVASRLGIKFPLNVLFIQIKYEFEEMKFFLENINNYYYKNSLKFIAFNDQSKTMKDCLNEMKITNPSISSILLGTRRSDGPYFKGMMPFASTDGDWPKFMRINPILDWTFSEIWYFIRKLQLPYCKLYDQGYTSIDNTQNTVRNENLLKSDGFSYLPAYMLENQEAERDSRKKSN